MSFKVKVFDEQTDTVEGMTLTTSFKTPIEKHSDVVDGLHTLFTEFTNSKEPYEQIHVLIRGYKSNGDVTYVGGNIPNKGTMEMATKQFIGYGKEGIKKVDPLAEGFANAMTALWVNDSSE